MSIVFVMYMAFTNIGKLTLDKTLESNKQYYNEGNLGFCANCDNPGPLVQRPEGKKQSVCGYYTQRTKAHEDNWYNALI